MKILITCDLHVQEGIYTDICLDYLNFLDDYCSKNDIKTIVIAGDVFEKSSKIKNESFLPLFFKFMELKEKGYNIIILLGNHDIYNVDNDSLVEAFCPFAKVIKTTEDISFNDRELTFLPYTKDIRDIPEKGDVLITHLSIANFRFDNNYHVNEKIAFEENLFENFNKVFTGHFHKPQERGNIIYPGSPYQMNFGECGQEKGFVVFDTESDKWERILYKGAPTYKKIKVEDFIDSDVSNQFIEVEINEKVDSYVKLKHLLYERGALNVVPHFKQEEVDLIIDENAEVNFNDGLLVMMEEYIANNIKIENIDNEKLLELFREIQ